MWPCSSIHTACGTLIMLYSARNLVIDVDQARIGRLGVFDPRPRRIGAAALERHGNHDEFLALQFFVQCLPHGQVESAASPRGPTRQQHLAAAIVRQPVHAAVEIRQFEVRRVERPQRVVARVRPALRAPSSRRIRLPTHGRCVSRRERGDIDLAPRR